MASIVGTGVGVVLLLAALGLSVFGIVDAARRSQAAWDRAGQSKVLWIVLLVVSIILDFIFLTGLIISILYLVVARSRLGRAGTGEAQPGGWGQAPWAWGQSPGSTPPSSPGSPSPAAPAPATGDPGRSGSPVAGWYADPGGSGQRRYWDGRSWTAELRP
ncbi:MAG: DUF2510 domain-containing protein [Actinomycetota bacterium]|nr:DUF2510 domain-containing protein [Actinomycetota bacterium]